MNLLIFLLIFVLSILLYRQTYAKEGYSYSVNPCDENVSYIKKNDHYSCFDKIGLKESTLNQVKDTGTECEINPNGNIMVLYDFRGEYIEYTTPSVANCNPYNVMIRPLWKGK